MRVFSINFNEKRFFILGDDLYPKCLDKDNPEVTRMDKLPACEVKHRIYSKSSNSNELIIENFTPNCGHVAPLCSKI